MDFEKFVAHNKHDVSQKELRKAADMLRKRYGGNCPGSDVRGGLKVALEYIWMVNPKPLIAALGGPFDLVSRVSKVGYGEL